MDEYNSFDGESITIAGKRILVEQIEPDDKDSPEYHHHLMRCYQMMREIFNSI